MSLARNLFKIEKSVDSLTNAISNAFYKAKPLFELDKAIKASALSMGVLSKEGVGFRNTLKEVGAQTSLINVNLKQLAELQSAYSEGIGRTVILTEEGLHGMAEMSKMTGLGAEGAAQLAINMDAQGLSAERTAKFVEETLNNSNKYGVNATKIMKQINQNLSLINKYSFKEGVKGLSKMAQLTTKLGVDMSTVGVMADKLWDIEGAVEMSAQLNVMGGAWARLADPMHLMYMARNDMKGLTEEIANAAKESMFFNNLTGEIDMTAEGMHKLKIISQQTNIEYDKLVTMGKNMMKFDKIKSEVSFNVGGSQEDKELLDYIASKSGLDETGKATINIGGQPKLLSQLNDMDKKMLMSQMQEKKSLKQRAEEAQSFDEQITGFIDSLKISLLPIIEAFDEKGGLGEAFRNFAKDFNGPNGWGVKIANFAKVIGQFISSIGTWAIENKELVVAIWAFGKAAGLLLGGLTFLKNLGPLIEGLISVGKLIFSEVGLIVGGIASIIGVIKDQFDFFSDEKTRKTGASGWLESLGGSGMSLIDWIPGVNQLTEASGIGVDNMGTDNLANARAIYRSNNPSAPTIIPNKVLFQDIQKNPNLYTDDIISDAKDVNIEKLEDGTSKLNRGPFMIKDGFGKTYVTNEKDRLAVSPNIDYSGKMVDGGVIPEIKKYFKENKFNSNNENQKVNQVTSSVNHEFNELKGNININIKVDSQNSTYPDIENNESFKRKVRDAVIEQTFAQLNMNKTKQKA